MRQTHALTDPRHKPQQAVNLLKNKVRKYLKRERRKALPDGVDFWDFDCRAGDTEQTAVAVPVAELMAKIDEAVGRGSLTVYLEILAKPGRRAPRLRERTEVIASEV